MHEFRWLATRANFLPVKSQPVIRPPSSPLLVLCKSTLPYISRGRWTTVVQEQLRGSRWSFTAVGGSCWGSRGSRGPSLGGGVREGGRGEEVSPWSNVMKITREQAVQLRAAPMRGGGREMKRRGGGRRRWRRRRGPGPATGTLSLHFWWYHRQSLQPAVFIPIKAILPGISPVAVSLGPWPYLCSCWLCSECPCGTPCYPPGYQPVSANIPIIQDRW